MQASEFTKIGVIGGGSWGTTLANLLAEKGYGVDLWVREEEVYLQIKEEGTNSLFLPGISLTPRLKPVTSFEQAVAGKELILIVVPSHVFRTVVAGIKPHLAPGTALVAATKGIENDTLMTMAQATESVLGKEHTQDFAALAGPSFAKEVILKYPTAVTVACRNIEHASRLQRVFYTDYLRVYATQDLIGVELAGALKNVVAIAAGTADGLNFGHNARAALITRGLSEMTRLGVVMGAHPLTFAGLAGMGDLVLTCTGDLSRNRMVGLKIGQGMTLRDAVDGMSMVAEGVNTSIAAYQLAQKMNVEMPIVKQVYEILHEAKDPKAAVKDLMARALKQELDGL
jgi:glycerol-3-phosphate dehydrogenase (NAD(P)+)